MLRFAEAGAGGLCWHATVYDDHLAIHAEPDEWGWHARSYSRTWLGIEFVQPREADDITDAQVRAAAWWIRERVLARWPGMELELRAHSEIKPGIDDGKTDVFRIGDPRLADLKQRIAAATS